MRDIFSEFVRLWRRWFATLFVLTFGIGLYAMGQQYHSAIEIVGFAAVAALVTTTVLSLLSAPVVFLVARRRVRKQPQQP